MKEKYPLSGFILKGNVILLTCLFLLILPEEIKALETKEPVISSEWVILLHGMNRTKNSMDKLEEHLNGTGYRTLNIGYPSTSEAVGSIAANHLTKMVKKCQEEGAEKIHMVTHSLGGIIVRQYLQNNHLPDGSRIVMLSPPNKGSELADTFHDLFIYEWINGPAGQELKTEASSLPNTLKPVEAEIGVITGDSTLNPLYSSLIPGLDDGKVSIESAKLAEMKDFLIVDSSHSFIMNHPEVLEQVVYFIKNGEFDHSATEQ